MSAEKMRRRSKGRTILLIVLTVFVVGFIVFSILSQNTQKTMNQPTTMPNLSTASDGVWTGSFQAWPVSAEVSVEIVNHEIKNITLVNHFTGRGQAAEQLTSAAVSEQTVELDAVSGATLSSKVILESIRQALLAAGATP